MKRYFEGIYLLRHYPETNTYGATPVVGTGREWTIIGEEIEWDIVDYPTFEEQAGFDGFAHIRDDEYQFIDTSLPRGIW